MRSHGCHVVCIVAVAVVTSRSGDGSSSSRSNSSSSGGVNTGLTLNYSTIQVGPQVVIVIVCM